METAWAADVGWAEENGGNQFSSSKLTRVGAGVVAVQGSSGAVRSSLDSGCVLQADPAACPDRDYVGCEEQRGSKMTPADSFTLKQT